MKFRFKASLFILKNPSLKLNISPKERDFIIWALRLRRRCLTGFAFGSWFRHRFAALQAANAFAVFFCPLKMLYDN